MSQVPSDAVFIAERNPRLPELTQRIVRARHLPGWLLLTVTLVLGGLLLAAAISSLTSGDETGAGVPAVIGVVVLMIVGCALAISNICSSQSAEVELLKSTHLFVVTSNSIEFPATGKLNPEAWPLPNVSAEIHNGRLVLRHPKFSRRSYRQIHAADPLAELARRINDAKAAAPPHS